MSQNLQKQFFQMGWHTPDVLVLDPPLVLVPPTLTEEEGPMLFGQNFNKRSDTENIFVSSLAEEYMFFIIPI